MVHPVYIGTPPILDTLFAIQNTVKPLQYQYWIQFNYRYKENISVHVFSEYNKQW